MRLGFIGTGTITSAIVNGLMRFGPSDVRVLVSPRNVDVARALAERHARVEIADSNQAVIDEVDIVVLSVRPQIAMEVLAELIFREDQNVISLISTLKLDDVARLVAPAGKISLAAPLPPVEAGLGATAVFPDNKVAHTIFDALGVVVAANSQDKFSTLVSATAIMGSYFGIVHHLVSWMAQQGVEERMARRYLTQILYGLAISGRERSAEDMSHLRKEFSTAGGLNEQFYQILEEDGVLDALTHALTVIRTRIRGV